MTEESALRTKVQSSLRDNRRVDTLNQALRDIDAHTPGTFALHLVRECVVLWRDVLHEGGRFVVGEDQSRSGVAVAGSAALVSHMGQEDIDRAVSLLVSGNLSDDADLRKMIDESL